MKNQKEIYNILRKNKDGLTITEIINKSKISRSTIRTILARLEGARKVKFRSVGMAKLYFLK